MTHVMKFNVFRWSDFTLTDLTFNTPPFAPCAPATLASFLIFNVSTSVSLGGLQTRCFLCLEYSSPLTMFLPKGGTSAGLFSVLNFLALYLQAVRFSRRIWAAKHVYSSLPTPSTWRHWPWPRGTESVRTQNNVSSFLPFLCLCSKMGEMRITASCSLSVTWCCCLLTWEMTSLTGRIFFFLFVCLFVISDGPLELELKCPHPAGDCLILVGAK